MARRDQQGQVIRVYLEVEWITTRPILSAAVLKRMQDAERVW